MAAAVGVIVELPDVHDLVQRTHVAGEVAHQLGIEAAVPFGWERYLGPDGIMIGMPGFGASAPAGDLYAHFGITVDAVTEAARKRLSR